MRKIILATDFSELAKPAAVYAAEIAKAADAELILFHAFQIGLIDHEAYAESGMNPEDKAYYQKEFDAINAHIRETTGLEDARAVLVNGYPVEEILNFVHQESVDLVVVGSHGEGRANSFFGSSTAALIEASHPPTLAVPPKAEFKKPKHLLLADDLRTVDVSSFLQFMRLARIFDADVHLLHGSEIPANSTDRQLLRSIINDFAAAINYENDFHAEELEINDEQAFVKQTKIYIKENHIDICAMLTASPNWWQRITGRDMAKQMPFMDDVPLLAIQPLGRLKPA